MSWLPLLLQLEPAAAGNVLVVGPLLLAIAAFSIGAAGVLLRRNAIIVFACIEMMMNAANIAFVAAANAWGGADGRLFVFFVIVIAAAEAAVGLGIVIALHRLHGGVDIDRANLMGG